MKSVLISGFVAAALTGAAATSHGQHSDEAAQLAKQLANPVAALISVPFQANYDFNMGPTGNGSKFTLNFQPVVPI